MNLISTSRIAGALALVTLVAGCDMGLQEKLDQQKAERYAAAQAAVVGVETERTNQLASSVPAADAKFEGNEHPLVTWRKQILARDDEKTLDQLSHRAEWEGDKVGAKGTPAQLAADQGISYLKEASSYWDGSSSLDRYIPFLDTFIKDAEAQKGKTDKDGNPLVPPPFLDEARFDRVFAFAARFLQLTKIESRDAVLPNVQADWEVVFDFPSHSRESFSDYVSRICFAHEQLKAVCGNIPHEYRAAAIDRPYLELLKKQADEFKAGDKGQVYADVMKRFSEAVGNALKDQPTPTEEPVLPSTIAAAGGISGVRTVFSPKAGVYVGTDKVADSFSGTVPSDFATAAQKSIDTLKSTPGVRVNYERVVLEMPGDVKVGEVRDAISAFMGTEETAVVKQIALVGRRRADQSMRQAAMDLKLPHPKTSRTRSYSFTADGPKTSCSLMGFMGEALIGEKKDYYLEITPSSIRAIGANYDGEKKEWETTGEAIDLGTPADTSKLEAWLKDHTGEIQIFLSQSFSYDDGMGLISHVLFQCKDEELTIGQGKTATTLVRPCGKSESRENTVILAICGG
ncbi:MAG: hypothetical protein KC635_09325 [Myxococcales bacterium]|nr:hypothetical protein [Myxococcales bacterium]MCB9733973.1 hypothetical protein [Deltaproteobacteria bacterium]